MQPSERERSLSLDKYLTAIHVCVCVCVIFSFLLKSNEQDVCIRNKVHGQNNGELNDAVWGVGIQSLWELASFDHRGDKGYAIKCK